MNYPNKPYDPLEEGVNRADRKAKRLAAHEEDLRSVQAGVTYDRAFDEFKAEHDRVPKNNDELRVWWNARVAKGAL